MNAVRFDHVSKAFGALKVLDDISFEIPAGQAFCLLGRSGTGKSVTLRHINGLTKPDAGDALPDVGVRPVGVAPHRKRDVVADRHRVEQRRVLKQKAHLLPNIGQFSPGVFGGRICVIVPALALDTRTIAPG